MAAWSDGSMNVLTADVASLCAGDVNDDGVIDNNDLNMVKAAFGQSSTQPGYNPAADIDRNGIINITDLSYVSKSLGCKLPVKDLSVRR